MGVYCVRSGVGVCGDVLCEEWSWSVWGVLCEEWSWSVWGCTVELECVEVYCVRNVKLECVEVYCVRNVKLECVGDIVCEYSNCQIATYVFPSS